MQPKHRGQRDSHPALFYEFPNGDAVERRASPFPETAEILQCRANVIRIGANWRDQRDRNPVPGNRYGFAALDLFQKLTEMGLCFVRADGLHLTPQRD